MNVFLSGIFQEVVEVVGERKKLHFIKLSAPWDVLVDYAELLCFRAPLQMHSHSQKVRAPRACNVVFE